MSPVRRPRHAVRSLLSLSLALLAAAPVVAVPRPAAAKRAKAGKKGAAPAPKLVVLLSVDQMRADYVDWYGANWTRGFRTLIDGGAYFRNARYPYLKTVTCPGHTTIGTGAFPHRHGMILNSWWDRESQKLVECTEDLGSALVHYGTPPATPSAGDSARRMLVPTLADEMKRQLSPQPRVASFSFKARSAIGLSGHQPDIVSWWEAGGYVTAKAFTGKPNPALKKILAANPVEAFLETPWEKVLPAAAYKYRDDAPEEKSPATQWTVSFPHVLKDAAASGAARYSLWEKSPLPDALTGALTRGVLADLKWGQKKGTDFLAASFSALDTVGHSFGPRSHEIQDVLARLDVVLGELIDALDKRVGRDNYVLALSADHGVATLPEQLKAEGKDAGRVNPKEVTQKLGAALNAELGEGKHIAANQYTDVYLAPGVLDRLRQKNGAMKRVLDAVRGCAGVGAVYSVDDLRDAWSIKDPVQRAAALSQYPGRSGDIIVAPKENWMYSTAGTTHGTQHDYDQHVPVLLFGAGIRPGRYERPASPADIVPTLARLVRVDVPYAEGRVLTEALALPRPAEAGGEGAPAGAVAAAKGAGKRKARK